MLKLLFCANIFSVAQTGTDLIEGRFDQVALLLPQFTAEQHDINQGDDRGKAREQKTDEPINGQSGSAQPMRKKGQTGKQHQQRDAEANA